MSAGSLDHSEIGGIVRVIERELYARPEARAWRDLTLLAGR